MSKSTVRNLRLAAVTLLASVVVVGIVIISLQWRTVSVLHYGLLYNSGKKAIDSNTLYMPGRYYVGAGSYFMEFPSTQKAIIFKSDNKQAFDTTGAYMMPVIVGLTNDGLSLNMSIVINYKLLDRENKAVSLGDQMVYIFNQLYGGSDEEEISDTVGLIAEADIMQIISLHPSSDFWTKRSQINQEFYTAIKESLKDYYITLNSVIIVNEEFPFKYQDAIGEIMAEMQKIEQRQFELEAQQILRDTAVSVANLNAQILAGNAATTGSVYAARIGAQKTAEVTYNSVLNTAVTSVKTDLDGSKISTLYKFFYLLALKMTQTPATLYLARSADLQASITSATG